MKVFVTVKPGSKENRVKQIDPTHFRLNVKASPVEGRANRAVIELIAKYFGIPKSRISVTAGLRSKQKTVNIS